MISKRELRIGLIRSKIEQIYNSLAFIEENLPAEFGEFNKSKVIRNAIYKETEFVVELFLDVCAVINSDLGLGIPEAEENILDNLESKQILDKNIIEIIKQIKKFRNILVHKYGKINDETAFDDIKEGLKDFELIIKEIEKFLEKHKIKKNSGN